MSDTTPGQAPDEDLERYRAAYANPLTDVYTLAQLEGSFERSHDGLQARDAVGENSLFRAAAIARLELAFRDPEGSAGDFDAAARIVRRFDVDPHRPGLFGSLEQRLLDAAQEQMTVGDTRPLPDAYPELQRLADDDERERVLGIYNRDTGEYEGMRDDGDSLSLLQYHYHQLAGLQTPLNGDVEGSYAAEAYQAIRAYNARREGFVTDDVGDRSDKARPELAIAFAHVRDAERQRAYGSEPLPIPNSDETTVSYRNRVSSAQQQLHDYTTAEPGRPRDVAREQALQFLLDRIDTNAEVIADEGGLAWPLVADGLPSTLGIVELDLPNDQLNPTEIVDSEVHIAARSEERRLLGRLARRFSRNDDAPAAEPTTVSVITHPAIKPLEQCPVSDEGIVQMENYRKSLLVPSSAVADPGRALNVDRRALRVVHQAQLDEYARALGDRDTPTATLMMLGAAIGTNVHGQDAFEQVIEADTFLWADLDERAHAAPAASPEHDYASALLSRWNSREAQETAATLGELQEDQEWKAQFEKAREIERFSGELSNPLTAPTRLKSEAERLQSWYGIEDPYLEFASRPEHRAAAVNRYRAAKPDEAPLATEQLRRFGVEPGDVGEPTQLEKLQLEYATLLKYSTSPYPRASGLYAEMQPFIDAERAAQQVAAAAAPADVVADRDVPIQGSRSGALHQEEPGASTLRETSLELPSTGRLRRALDGPAVTSEAGPLTERLQRAVAEQDQTRHTFDLDAGRTHGRELGR